MPISFDVDHARRRITCIWEPPVENDEIIAVVERAAGEGVWRYAVLHDARAVEPRGVARARAMMDRVKRLEAEHGPRGPVALVAKGATVGSAQAYAFLGDQAGQTIQVFWDREAADAWLDSVLPGD